MLYFRQSDTAIPLILTLTENVSITAPYFLFVFTNVVTKDTVSFIRAATADESLYAFRYNKFTINPSSVFVNQQPGEWHYSIYQQASPTNTNPTLTQGLLETGKLILDRSVDFGFTKYDSPNSFKIYNG